MNSLTYMFRPQSLAVVGASDDPEKWGHGVLRNIIEGGYEGRVYAVNPRADTVLGMPCYKTLSDVPDEIDLAFIVIPSPFVVGAVREAIA